MPVRLSLFSVLLLSSRLCFGPKLSPEAMAAGHGQSSCSGGLTLRLAISRLCRRRPRSDVSEKAELGLLRSSSHQSASISFSARSRRSFFSESVQISVDSYFCRPDSFITFHGDFADEDLHMYQTYVPSLSPRATATKKHREPGCAGVTATLNPSDLRTPPPTNGEVHPICSLSCCRDWIPFLPRVSQACASPSILPRIFRVAPPLNPCVAAEGFAVAADCWRLLGRTPPILLGLGPEQLLTLAFGWAYVVQFTLYLFPEKKFVGPASLILLNLLLCHLVTLMGN